MHLVVKSIAFSFLVTIPLGPVAFLIVREMFFGVKYRWIWFALGMMISDIFYSFVILLNLHYIEDFLYEYQLPLEILSGMLLFAIGATTLYKLRKMPKELHTVQEKKEYKSLEPVEAFLTALLSCIGNVSQLLTFTLLFTSLGLVLDREIASSTLIFSISFVVAATLTWGLIYASVLHLKKNIHDSHTTIEKFSAWVICLTGVILVAIAVVKRIS